MPAQYRNSWLKFNLYLRNNPGIIRSDERCSRGKIMPGRAPWSEMCGFPEGMMTNRFHRQVGPARAINVIDDVLQYGDHRQLYLRHRYFRHQVACPALDLHRNGLAISPPLNSPQRVMRWLQNLVTISLNVKVAKA